MKINNLNVGTSGLVLRQKRTEFPEESRHLSRLQFYSTIFKSIEINSSFYRLHKPATIAKWSREVADDFTFTFKVWKEITHAKGLAFEPADVAKFMSTLTVDRRKQGCVLVQFPASIDSSYATKLSELLIAIEASSKDTSWKLAVEFRHPSWYSEQTTEMIRTHNATIVLHDMPRAQLMTPQTESDVLYLRFHGSDGTYRGFYDKVTLDNYAHQIGEWRKSGRCVFVYFNNTIGGAYEDALYLRSKLAD